MFAGRRLYSNVGLNTVYVSRGQQIRTGQPLKRESVAHSQKEGLIMPRRAVQGNGGVLGRQEERGGRVGRAFIVVCTGGHGRGKVNKLSCLGLGSLENFM